MGGNVFDSATPIKREYIEATINEYKKTLANIFYRNFGIEDSFEVCVVGSAGKKDVSNDIDLAISDSFFTSDRLISVLTENYNWKQEFDKLVSRARTSSEQNLKTKASLICVGKVINNLKEYNIEVNLKKITTGSLFSVFPQYNSDGKNTGEFVQIDWLLGNLDWVKFSCYSKTYKGNIKGLHRTQLMLSLFDYKGLSFSHSYGVKEKESGNVVASSPKEAVELLSRLYRINLTEEIVSDYHHLYEAISRIPELQEVTDIYLKILDKTRCDIPENIQGFWIEHKERLNLTGKFLPEGTAFRNMLIKEYGLSL